MEMPRIEEVFHFDVRRQVLHNFGISRCFFFFQSDVTKHLTYCTTLENA